MEFFVWWHYHHRLPPEGRSNLGSNPQRHASGWFSTGMNNRWFHIICVGVPQVPAPISLLTIHSNILSSWPSITDSTAYWLMYHKLHIRWAGGDRHAANCGTQPSPMEACSVRDVIEGMPMPWLPGGLGRSYSSKTFAYFARVSPMEQ